MGLYEELAGTAEGQRALASARLRERALEMLDQAMARSGVNQAELARRLGRRRHAVSQLLSSDGNLKLSTLAEYLGALGCEVELELFEVGELRNAEIEDRMPVNASHASQDRRHAWRPIVYRHFDEPADTNDTDSNFTAEVVGVSTTLDAGGGLRISFPVPERRTRQDA